MKVKWNLQQIYFYLVCFVTLIMIIIGAVNTVRSAVDFLLPDPAAADESFYYSKFTGVEGRNLNEQLFDQEIVEKELSRQEKINRTNSNNQSVRSLLGGVILILVAGPAYLYHWRQIPGLESHPPQE
ncbi:hypothetical protein [Candidatus Contubernalis alkaliaceticus]|uniref:hypothetical protein n=1 Tax=Candidatus Contubernalis alkaliaceticus TaxID=338645 RepID=UPI001F4BF857|nr:hypothetical protein [Candidatus Contubernalis alkalaceticus]UNC93415.1 hypothetical protein HUE98_15825 [Candidatus Contubernalis alkalaceticus]